MGVTLEHDDVHGADAVQPVHEPSVVSSRRKFFATAAAAAMVLGTREAKAQSIRRAKRKLPEPVRGVSLALAQTATPPDAQLAVWRDPVARLLRRATLGITKEELTRAQKLGYGKYLDEQLKPSTIDDREVAAYIATNYPTLSLTPDALYGADQNKVMTEIQEATLYRAAFSRR